VSLAGIQLFEDQADQYDAWFRSPRGRLLYESELAALGLLLDGVSGPLLDVGCGTGVFSAALGVTLGVDPSRRALGLACKRGVPVIQGVGEQLPLAEGRFGGVLFVTSFCYIDDPARALAEAHRALFTDGRVIVAEINRESAWGRDYLRRGESGDPFYASISLYTPAETAALLRAAGFEPEAYTSTLLQPPEGVTRVETPVPAHNPDAGFICVRARKRQEVA
jgi:SAM-dependent methyltransferase